MVTEEPFAGAHIEIDLYDVGAIQGGVPVYVYRVYGRDSAGTLLDVNDAVAEVWANQDPVPSRANDADEDADLDHLIANLQAAYPGASVLGNYDFDLDEFGVTEGDELTEVVVIDPWAAAQGPLPPEIDPAS